MGNVKSYGKAFDRLFQLDGAEVLKRCCELLEARYGGGTSVSFTRKSIRDFDRVVKRLRLTDRRSGAKQQLETLKILSLTPPKFFDHVTRHARRCCSDSRPKCESCPLVSFCKTGVRHVIEKPAGKYALLDLFAGAGALSSGFRKQGFHIALAVERDRSAAQSYRFNNPGVPVFESDVKKLDLNALDTILQFRKSHYLGVIAGPPCQGFSVAGPRQPHARRNLLFKAVANLANKLNADLVLMENVPGLKSVSGVSFEDRIIRYFEKKDYAGKAFPVDASNFGVPQRRKRLIFVFSRAKKPLNTPPLERSSSRQCRCTVSKALKGLPRPFTRDSEVRRMRLKSYLPNHRVMAHSPSVIQKIAKITVAKGPISYRRLRSDLAHTLIAGHRAMPVHPWLNRTITVREAARIQTLPDTFRFLGPHSEQPLQVANVVPYRMARAIARGLAGSLKGRS